MHRQEGLAVARIARDDGSSSTNRSSNGYDYNYQPLGNYAVTQLRILQATHFSVTHFIPSLRTSVTQILLGLRVLYVGRYAVYVRCGAVLDRCGPMC